MGAALYRAAHQILDSPPVFDDPLALRIVGSDAEQALRDGRDQRIARPGLRAFIAVRSRLAEDRLAAACRRGVRQYVLLGAGLDTFGYRNDHPGLRVFEVDQPATQGGKRARLAAAGIAVPGSLTFAAVDFERETLADGLARAGFDLTAPAQFAMLGVSMYLTAQALAGTASFVAARPAGTEIVLDYATPPGSLDRRQRRAAAALAARVSSAGEPFTAAFEPGELHDMLNGLGFTEIEDFDAAALNSRYLAGRADGLAMRGGARIVTARV
jgi:methyltransferase (TIGR00027 family)